MSAPTQEQLQRQALEIALWAQGRGAPPPEALAKLGLPSPDGRALDDGSQETGVGNAYGEDGSWVPDLGPLASFGSWQSVAATVLRKVEDSAGFDSSSTAFDPGQWNSFWCQFATNPFIININGDSRSKSISSLSLSPAIVAVIELIGEWVAPDALTGVINSIKKIGQLAVENRGQWEKDSNVQQGVLTVVNGQLFLGLLRTTVQMQYTSGKGYHHLNQQITVNSLLGTLDYDMCKWNARTLQEWDGRDVDSWVNGAASYPYPPNTSPAWDN